MPHDSAAIDYCADQVRRLDHERYLATIFAPVDRRADLLAVYAFNLEVAKTRETVSEAMIGHMRLQWWRDAIAGIYDGTPRRHQVVAPLAHAIARHTLSRAVFDRLIDARAADLDDDPPADLAALTDYADATAGGVFRLACAVSGQPAGQGDDVLRAAGVAWGLAGLLRALPMHLAAKRIYLPQDVLGAAGVEPDALLGDRPPAGLDRAVSTIAAEATRHLDAARAGLPAITRPARPALSVLALARAYLRRLDRAGSDVFRPALAPDGAGRVLRVGKAAMTRRW